MVTFTKDEKSEIVKNTLSPFFTPAMIECFIKGTWKTVRNWGKEDICIALTLRQLRKKAYEYLRKSKMIPLPSVSFLKKQAHYWIKI